MQKDLNQLMNQTIQNMKETLQNEHFIIACSTGVDSSVLLSLVSENFPIEQWAICHVNHEVRKESQKEEEYITSLAKQNHWNIYITHLEQGPKASFEEWARKKRYEFFLSTAKSIQAKYILTAHQADDELETILMRLFKSGSLKSYRGIDELSPVTSAHEDRDIYLYRPLLKLSKENLYSYAKEKEIIYFEDVTNQEDYQTRNQIRHQLVPIIKKNNPNWVEGITNYHDTLYDTEKKLSKSIADLIKDNVSVNNSTTTIQFDCSFYDSLDYFTKKEVLFTLLYPFQLSKSTIDECIHKLDSATHRLVTPVAKGLNLIKEYGKIVLTKESIEESRFYLKIEKEGTYPLLGNQEICVDKNICYFNDGTNKLWYNIVKLPLIVRTREKEDRVYFPFGSQSVSNYLTNRKVPYLKRMNTLLLCDESNQVLTILGYKIKVKVEEEKNVKLNTK